MATLTERQREDIAQVFRALHKMMDSLEDSEIPSDIRQAAAKRVSAYLARLEEIWREAPDTVGLRLLLDEAWRRYGQFVPRSEVAS